MMEPSQDNPGSPYLTVRIAKSSDNISCEQVESTPKHLFPVPNIILFRLGVILLELTLEEPFADLQEAHERNEGKRKEFTKFHQKASCSQLRCVKEDGSQVCKAREQVLVVRFRVGPWP